jgi:citrate lyase beta subunit
MSGTLSRNVPCGYYYKRRLASAACSADDTAVARAREIVAAFKENSTDPFVVEGEPIELPGVRSMHCVLAVAGWIARTR